MTDNTTIDTAETQVGAESIAAELNAAEQAVSAPEPETTQTRKPGRAPASPNKLAALLSIGVGGAARTKHAAHAADNVAFAALKDLGLGKKKSTSDFIMVGYENTTKLGLFLERTTKADFTYPTLGKWASVASLRSYLESSYMDEASNTHFDETWRFIHSYECKRKWKTDNCTRRHIPAIKTIVADATYQKIIQNQEYMFLMAESEGRFVNSTGADYTRDWYMLALEEIRQCLKERTAVALDIQQSERDKIALEAIDTPTEEDQAALKHLVETQIPALYTELEGISPDFTKLDSVMSYAEQRQNNGGWKNQRNNGNNGNRR